MSSSSCSCCVAHDNKSAAATAIDDKTIATLRNLYSRVVISQRGVETRVCLDSFAPTLALQSLAEDAERAAKNGSLEPVLVINALKLCKSHRGEHTNCKLGVNCRNIHLCKQVTLTAAAARQPLRLPPIARVAPTVQPSAATASPAVVDAPENAADVEEHIIPRGGSTPTPPPLRKRLGGRRSASVRVSAKMTRESCDESLDAIPSFSSMPTPPTSRPSSGTKRATSVSRSNSPVPPTTCLNRFVRRWHAPLRSSGSSVGSTSNSQSLTLRSSTSDKLSSLMKKVNAVSAAAASAAPPAHNNHGLSDFEDDVSEGSERKNCSDDDITNGVCFFDDVVNVSGTVSPAPPRIARPPVAVGAMDAPYERRSIATFAASSADEGFFAVCA